MKKIVALALCLVMVLGLMSGCEKTMDLDTLIQKMDEAAKTVTAQGMTTQMELDMEMSVTGMTMTMGMDMEMEMKAKSDLSAMYMDMKMAVEAMGESEETDMEIYGTMEDGVMVTYTYEPTTATWIRIKQDGYGDMMNQLSGMQQSLGEMPKEQMVLGEEKVTVNDRECYVLTVNMAGDLFQTYMSDYMGTMISQITGAGEMDEESLALLEEMDWTAMSASCVYHLDAETFLPLEMSMEIDGMGEVMNDLLGSVMLGVDAGEIEFSIDVPTVKIATRNMVYNEAVEVPAVPQEALDNAIDGDAVMEEEPIVTDDEYLTNPPQADGSYLLSLGGDTVRVMVPEGYTVMDSGNDYVAAMTDDYLNGVYYMLYTDMTVEDMQTQCDDEVAWAKENSWYGSHTEPAELDGYTTRALIYNDGTSVWYAWKELNGSVLLLVGEVEGETFDMASLITTVEIVAE